MNQKEYDAKISEIAKKYTHINVDKFFILQMHIRLSVLEKMCDIIGYALYGAAGLFVLLAIIMFMIANHTH